tara:strand:- start:254 stop:433 length:180 start_codon:yes stop_codon:yes gene_type:complete
MTDEHSDDKHITLYGDGYYFWDEASLNRYGPYKTKQEARDMLKKYAEEVLGIGGCSSDG